MNQIYATILRNRKTSPLPHSHTQINTHGQNTIIANLYFIHKHVIYCKGGRIEIETLCLYSIACEWYQIKKVIEIDENKKRRSKRQSTYFYTKQKIKINKVENEKKKQCN